MKTIGTVRPSMLGDLIISLVFAQWYKNRFPHITQIAYVDKKCQQILPLLYNHDCIEGFRISESSDKLSDNDRNYFFDNFNVSFNPYPSLTDENYFNKRSIIEETFLMTTQFGAGRIDPGHWEDVREDEKFPKLNVWFELPKNNAHYIGIWPQSGYSIDPANNKRNPSKQYWAGLVERLYKENYTIVQLGTKDHELVSSYVLDGRDKSLLEAIKFSLICECSIGTDSGSQWCLGAYGVNQVLLTTYWKNNHYQNPTALIPVNHKKRAINLFHRDINKIEYDLVVEAIRILK